jgi:hypothetical protein
LENSFINDFYQWKFKILYIPTIFGKQLFANFVYFCMLINCSLFQYVSFAFHHEQNNTSRACSIRSSYSTNDRKQIQSILLRM